MRLKQCVESEMSNGVHSIQIQSKFYGMNKLDIAVFGLKRFYSNHFVKPKAFVRFEYSAYDF